MNNQLIDYEHLGPNAPDITDTRVFTHLLTGT